MPRTTLGRDQLTKFLPNHEAIRAFEKVLADVNGALPDAIEVANNNANSALSNAYAALLQMTEMANQLAQVALAPNIQVQSDPDDLIPADIPVRVVDDLFPSTQVMQIADSLDINTNNRDQTPDDLSPTPAAHEISSILSRIDALEMQHVVSKGVVLVSSGDGLEGGDITDVGTLSLANVLTAGGPTGDSNTIPVLTWNAFGQLTAVTTASVGLWTTPAFDASDFTGNGSMTWTVDAGDVTTFDYAIIGKTMHLNFVLFTTTVGGTPNTILQIKLPAGAISAKRAGFTYMLNQGAWVVSRCEVSAGSNQVSCYVNLTTATNWAASTNATYLLGSIAFEIQ